MKDIIAFVVPLCSMGAGVWLLFLFMRAFVRMRGISTWGTTSGAVLESKIDEVEWRGKSGSYVVRVLYRYTVNGRSYESGRIHPAYGQDWHYDSHRALFERLQTNAGVKVYYDPRDPAQSYLAKGFVSTVLIPLVAGMMFFGMGVFLGFLGQMSKFGGADYAALILPP